MIDDESKGLNQVTDYAAKKGYQDKSIAEKYETVRFSSLRGRLIHSLELRAVQKALDQAGLTGVILDLPCGTARLMAPLTARGIVAYGADISEAMLKEAKTALASGGEVDGSNRLVRCDAEALPFPSRAFDGVVSMRFMGHTPPSVRRNILGEMKRISKHWLVVAFYISDPIFRMKRAWRKALSRPHSAFPVTWQELAEDFSVLQLRQVRAFPVARFHLSETHVILLSVN